MTPTIAITPSLVAPEGNKIPAVLEKANSTPSPHLCILTHGIFTDRDEKGRFLRLSERLRKRGIDVLRFDFLAHGRSTVPPRDFSVSRALSDYLTVQEWAHAHSWQKISLVGSSFGASVGLLERLLPRTVQLHRVALLNPVLDYQATFTAPTLKWGRGIFSPEAVIELQTRGRADVHDGFEVSLSFYLELCLLRPYEALAHMERPTLVLHGDQDDKVPLGPARRWCDNQPSISLKVVSGAGHAFKDPTIEQDVHCQVVSWIAQ